MKKLFVVVITIAALIFVATSALYIYQFGKNGLSLDQFHWGSFGDYFGGLINPILAFGNLLLLIYISRIVSNQEDRRRVNQLIHDSLKELQIGLKKFDHVRIKSGDADQLTGFITEFMYNNSFLFGNDEKRFQDLCFDTTKTFSYLDFELDKYYSKYNTEVVNLKVLRRDFVDKKVAGEEAELYKKILLSHAECSLQKHNLLNFMKRYLMNVPAEKITDVDIKQRGVESENVMMDSYRRHKHLGSAES